MDENKKKTYEIVNNLIAADDLHWNEEEQRYIALSREEIDEILLACIDQEMFSEKDCTRMLNWATHVKIGDILLRNFLTQRVKVVGFDKNDEPLFGKADFSN